MAMDIAIDLGSDRIRVYMPGKGKVLDEASVITYDVDTGEIFAVGDAAYKMIGKTPYGVRALHPVDGGVIARSDLVDNMVEILLRETCPVKVVMPRVVTAVPCGLTEVEKRAMVNAVSSFGARKVYLIESPKAAALGCGVDVTSPHGVFIADIGSGTADIAVISLGGLTVSRSVKRAGSAMDEEIVKFIRKKYNLVIGTNTAEACKQAVGCIKLPQEPKTFRLKGRDAVTGLPKFVEVTGEDILPAIEETARDIVLAVKDVLELTPPELAGDIYNDGIILTGGLSKLPGLAKTISEETRLRVRVHKFAQDCVIMGCGKAIRFIGEQERGTLRGGLSPLMAAY